MSNITVTTSMSFCTFHIQTSWPPVAFNCVTKKVKIDEKTYQFKTHGGWFMLATVMLSMLHIWSFHWTIALAIGAVIAAVWNVLTFAIFNQRIKHIIKNITETPSNNQPDIWSLYQANGSLVALRCKHEEGYNYLTLTASGHTGLVLFTYTETAQRFVEENGLAEYTPLILNRHQILELAKNIQVDAVFAPVAGNDDIQGLDLEAFAEIQAPTPLEIALSQNRNLYACQAKELRKGQDNYDFLFQETDTAGTCLILFVTRWAAENHLKETNLDEGFDAIPITCSHIKFLLQNKEDANIFYRVNAGAETMTRESFFAKF